MKKLVSILMVLAVAAMASAATVALQGPADVNPGDVVTINVFSDTAVGDMTIVSISDGAAGGSASNPVLAAGFDWDIFNNVGTLNDGALVKNATGKTGFMSPLVDGVLYSFDYTVAADISCPTITLTVDGNAGGTAIDALTMNVVPEPITVALLGLGGLFIRRRK